MFPSSSLSLCQPTPEHLTSHIFSPTSSKSQVRSSPVAGAEGGNAPGLKVTGAGLLSDGMDLTVVVVRAVVGVPLVVVVLFVVVVVVLFVVVVVVVVVLVVVGLVVLVVGRVVVAGVVAGVVERVELMPERETQSPGYCEEQAEPGWQVEQAGPEMYISPLMKLPVGP